MKNKKVLLIFFTPVILLAALTGCTGNNNIDATSEQTAEMISQTAASSELSEAISGEKAADFTVLDDNENEITLSQSFGKPTVIHFWSTKQKACKTELEFFNEIYPEYEGEVNFMIIHLTDRESENMFHAKAFMLENGYTFPVYYDLNGEAKKAYGVKGKPLTVFIDKNGSVFETFDGEITKPLLKGYIERMLAE